jgi:NAD(P)-dependent dehydrogenase (short-subunit alcohol dehydrogenase family)
MMSCDVRDPAEVDRTVDRAVERMGRLDVLVNNAGVIQVGPFRSMTMQDFHDAMDTHAWGSLYMTLAALPHMRRSGGNIVNVVSIGGKIGVPHLVPYVMSKFAQAGLSEALSAELSGERIYVTTVYPGLMRTGSHVNARFKGDHRKEFAWFSAGAGFPGFSMSACRAARQIVEACRNRKSHVVLTPAARVASLASVLAPDVLMDTLRKTNGMLPNNVSRGSSKSQLGWDSRSVWTAPLTVLADRAISRNNEQRTST